jgi:hypothetical protein
MLVPFATRVLGASIARFIRFLFETGLTFAFLLAVAGTKRASQGFLASRRRKRKRRGARSRMRSKEPGP